MLSSFDSIQVMIRVRPLSEKEKQENSNGSATDPVVIIGENHREIKVKKNSFFFDWVCGMSTTQNQIYEGIGSIMINSCLEGYNATILAYG